ncbi:hypothetical protein [Eubacterium sp. 14-2]|uniref:hypothetical protein n=1 Tax=Eubacterium sp. 14-2 TaxID=1235790 RepID=UPI0003998323|nr:hypothetical protein [Eubacterium sp. 14-2]
MWRVGVPEGISLNISNRKRAKNRGELDCVISEGKHQSIVIKEEFERVKRMMEKKRVQTE